MNFDEVLLFGKAAELAKEKIDPVDADGKKYIGLEHIEPESLSLSGHGYAEDVASSKGVFKKGDILFGKLRPYFRKVVMAPFDGICSTDIWVVRAKKGVDQAFLYYWMASKEFVDVATRGSEGTRMPRAKWDYVSRFQSPITDPKEQKSIGQVLRSLDDKIAINQQINRTLEAMAQAVFKSWFVDFDPTRTKMAALEAGGTAEDATIAAMTAISGKSTEELAALKTTNSEAYAELHTTASLFPSRLAESELGEIPESWSSGCIGDVAKAKGGFAFKSKDFQDEGYPVVKIKNITGDGRVELNDCRCVNDEAASKADRFELKDGDLVMAMTGATVGKVGFIVNGNKRSFLNQRVAKFESDTYGQKINWFLYSCFKRTSIFDSVVGAAQGSAQPNISSLGIESTNILLPSRDTIHAFCDLMEKPFRNWIANIEQSQTLTQLRDSLLPKLLSGELLVEDVEADL